MKRILDGLSRFQKEVFPEERALFSRLASSQSPEALFLTCADSRIVPGLLTQTRPGDLFICRNAGNIAPPHGEPAGGVSATIEYAVLALGVRDIIVCGHSDCGAMKGVMHPEKLASMPSVAAWLRHADRARVVTEENYGDLEPASRLAALTEQNVLAQLDNLRTYPSVASRLLKGALTLHGWVYDIESGVVRSYHADKGNFLPLPLAGETSDRSVEVNYA
ncbi:MAG: carbonic anhydrase [Bryobacteraceae bacterium]|nr:carbonic anhydrase [Bryobacteraceae bacterium]